MRSCRAVYKSLVDAGAFKGLNCQREEAPFDLRVRPVLCAVPAVSTKDISGTWVAKSTTPMGEIEIVYELKVDASGKITGMQKLPFGDSPIVDGNVTGDHVEMTVETESFGTISKATATATIVGDELQITPAMPAGGGRGRGAPGGGGRGRGFMAGPFIAKRGTPTPSYRAASVDYSKLPKLELPPLKALPSNGLAKTPPMGWNSWNKFRAQDRRQDGPRDGGCHGVERHEGCGLSCMSISTTPGKATRDAQGNITDQHQVSRHEGAGGLCPLEGAEDRHLFLARSEDLRADTKAAMGTRSRTRRPGPAGASIT